MVAISKKKKTLLSKVFFFHEVPVKWGKLVLLVFFALN